MRFALILFYVALAAPIAGLMILGLSQDSGSDVPWAGMLGRTLTETFALLFGVGLLSAIIGVGTAWLIAMYRFPGRDWLSVLLFLPLALPTYLAAYIIVELTDYFGPLQSLLRAVFGFQSRRDYWFPQIRSLPGAILTFSLVLYPYVYLPARLMFERQASRVIYAARLHGARGWRLFLRIGLPMVRPALAGGLAFVLLETLNDIGAVEHLGVQTFSMTVRALWLNRGSLTGAAQVSLVALGVVLIILIAEFSLRRQGAFAGSPRGEASLTPVRLRGARAWASTIACALPVLAGCVIPLLFLANEALRVIRRSGIAPELGQVLLNSLLLSAVAGICVAVIGTGVALGARLLRSPDARLAPRLGALGYAIPGSVLVIALLPIYGGIDTLLERLDVPLMISGTMAAIVIAYVLRFSGIGIVQAEAGLARLSRNIDHAARTLGCSIDRLALEILVPNIRRSIGLAALFAFVDGMKELPATLLLRPLNVETLATSLYAHASGGSFESGAVEALLLFAVGLIPVLLLARLR